jgi:hypothetical protein
MNNKNIISNKFNLNWSTTFSYSIEFAVLPIFCVNAVRSIKILLRICEEINLWENEGLRCVLCNVLLGCFSPQFLNGEKMKK